MIVPAEFQRRLKSLHPTLVVRWEYFKPQRQFIIPPKGVPFWRWEENGTVWYKWMPIPGMPKELRAPRIPGPDCRPGGCFVVRQPRPSYGDLSTVFDCIDEDGRLLPLDQYILDAISMRHDTDGSKWEDVAESGDKAIEDEVASRMLPIMDQLEETALDAFKQATGIKSIAVASSPTAKNSFDSFTVVDKRRFADAGDTGSDHRKNP